MSKMPPQGSCSIPQVLYLFFSHAANIMLMCRFNDVQMRGYADVQMNWEQPYNISTLQPFNEGRPKSVRPLKTSKGLQKFAAPLNVFFKVVFFFISDDHHLFHQCAQIGAVAVDL